MRLLDAIAQTNRPSVVQDAFGKRRQTYGLRRIAARMGDYPLRYVLDQSATEQCRELMVFAHEMFRPDDPFLRVPAERFWLEWLCDPDQIFQNSDDFSQVDMNSLRMGALISADASGRCGELQYFFEEANRPVMARVSLLFDFDRELVIPKGSKTLFRILHAELDHLNPLFQHIVMKLNPEWEFMASWQPTEFRRAISKLAQESWICLPFILAFSAMLNSGGILDERRSDLGRLNSVRAKAKRPPLLDHVEVGMRLGYGRYSEGARQLDTERQAPRLHFVRGHIVRRSGQTFWRTSHLRGDVAKPVVSRTVCFDARRSVGQEGGDT